MTGLSARYRPAQEWVASAQALPLSISPLPRSRCRATPKWIRLQTLRGRPDHGLPIIQPSNNTAFQ
jgi:hypothetical protein